jgi:WD40 repeat protein
MASGGFDGTIDLWEASNGRRKASFGIEGQIITNVYALAFSPNGKWLAAGIGSYNRGDMWGELRLLDAASGKRITTLLERHPIPVRSVAFSRDCRLLAACSDDDLRVWRLRTDDKK